MSLPIWSYSECEVIFTINGITHSVSGNDVPIETSLNAYIRNYAHLPGTKFMCLEGGCGSCVVSVKAVHPVTKRTVIFSVNSCLVPLFVCHGWAVTTVEGIGSKMVGYDKVQLTLAKFSGTQCGYCTPGFVMNMYSLLKSKEGVTMQEVEDSFDGNICRCTGYRPILDAFKSFSSDAPSELKEKCADIEDILKFCPRNGSICNRKCAQVESCTKQDGDSFEEYFAEIALAPKSLRLQLRGNACWYKAATIKEIFEIFTLIDDESYRFVAGNTAQGVYRVANPPNNYIDINGVAELKSHALDENTLTIGANTTLSEAIALFLAVAKEHPNTFGYTQQLARHILHVANVPVRNMGTIAGNLSIKHQHQEFPSDIFLLLETIGAKVTILTEFCEENTGSPQMFLYTDMTKKLISKVILPALEKPKYFLKTFKITPRAQNAHAYVNAGFCFNLNSNDRFRVVEKPSIVFGGINPDFIHATKTEEYLNDKQLLDQETLKGAVKILKKELKADHVLPDASPLFRETLAIALFYKPKTLVTLQGSLMCTLRFGSKDTELRETLWDKVFVLSLSPGSVTRRYRSGGKDLVRPLSSGKQVFETDKSLWPLNQPIPKLEALIQCSGEAEYVYDIPTLPGELYGALVCTSTAAATIEAIDPSKALSVLGVVAFYSAKDIKGTNNCAPPSYTAPADYDELFCSRKVQHAGQAIGVIVAETQRLANEAAAMVIVKYANQRKPELDMVQIINSGNKDRVVLKAKIEPKVNKGVHDFVCRECKLILAVGYPFSPVSGAGIRPCLNGHCLADMNKWKHTVSGTFEMKGQYHFTMETQTCVVVPIEDGFDVFSSTQWVKNIQDLVASVLAVSANSVNVQVRRLGGAYGCKIVRSGQVAAACAVAASHLNRPVRMALMLETNMATVGKRYPCYSNYEAGVDADGRIEKLTMNLYEDTGCSQNETIVESTIAFLAETYDSDTWEVNGYGVKTDLVPNTWCRAPGSVEAIATMEHIMEHIANVIHKDPLDVKLANMRLNSPLIKLVDDSMKSSSFATRKKDIDAFNSANRWKKRGIAVVPMDYILMYAGRYHAMVSIFAHDGTVAVSHGGVECGQGINTKVAQVCAHTLGIGLDMVKVKPTTTFISPNDESTGGSITSESVCYATMICCQKLLKRLEPIKEDADTKPSWRELVQTAFSKNIDLSYTYMFTTRDEVKNYDIYGVTTIEVEIDVLTGQNMIVRADVLEDAGQSLSPEVDIGQIEGALVMGLGYYLTEQLVYDPQNGNLLTNRTWNYKPFGAKDIPCDLRIELRKDAPNPLGVLRSKATGEPPFCMSVAVLFAIRNAVESARKDAGLQEDWFDFDPPYTVENIFLSCNSSIGQFKL